MSNERDRPAFPKGSTRTDLRLTKAPVDTPRGRLHQLAALGVRAAQEAKRVNKLSGEDVAKLRALGRRGVDLLWFNGDLGSKMVKHLCYGLDRVAGALALLTSVDFAEVSDGLTRTLVHLEVAERTIYDLQKERDDALRLLKFERGHVEQMRHALAASQVQVKQLLEQIPPERWEEPTRNSSMSEDDMRTISDPGEPPPR